MPLKTTPFDVAEHLSTLEDQNDLIADAVETGDPAFIRHTLNTVARARGMTQIARDAGVTREALYKALGPGGDPRRSTLLGVCSALGVQLSAEPSARVEAEQGKVSPARHAFDQIDRVIEVEEFAEEADISKLGKVESMQGTMNAKEDGDRVTISAHMDVIASDGTKVGTVDHMDGADTIKLAKNTSPDGEHHYVPMAWVDHISQHVHLRKSLADVEAAWLTSRASDLHPL